MNRLIVILNCFFIYFVLNSDKITDKGCYKLYFYLFSALFLVSYEIFIFIFEYKFIKKKLYSLEKKFYLGYTYFIYILLLMTICLYFYLFLSNFNTFTNFKIFTILSIISIFIYIIFFLIMYKMNKEIYLFFQDSEVIKLNNINNNDIENSRQLLKSKIIGTLFYMILYFILNLLIFDLKIISLVRFKLIFAFLFYFLTVVFVFIILYIYLVIKKNKFEKEKILSNYNETKDK